MITVLAAQTACSATVLPVLGSDMNGRKMPADDGLLVERVTYGRPRIASNQVQHFDPAAWRRLDLTRADAYGTKFKLFKQH